MAVNGVWIGGSRDTPDHAYCRSTGLEAVLQLHRPGHQTRGAVEGNGMMQSSSTRWAIGTLAVVAIAISLDTLRRTRDDFDGARAAPRVVRRQLDAFNRGDYRA